MDYTLKAVRLLFIHTAYVVKCKYICKLSM